MFILIFELSHFTCVYFHTNLSKASEYESHAGATGGLYGDKEKNYAEAVGMVVGNDPPGGVADEGALGGFKVVQSDMHQVIYGADSEGLCE